MWSIVLRTPKSVWPWNSHPTNESIRLMFSVSLGPTVVPLSGAFCIIVSKANSISFSFFPFWGQEMRLIFRVTIYFRWNVLIHFLGMLLHTYSCWQWYGATYLLKRMLFKLILTNRIDYLNFSNFSTAKRQLQHLWFPLRPAGHYQLQAGFWRGRPLRD